MDVEQISDTKSVVPYRNLALEICCRNYIDVNPLSICSRNSVILSEILDIPYLLVSSL